MKPKFAVKFTVTTNNSEPIVAYIGHKKYSTFTLDDFDLEQGFASKSAAKARCTWFCKCIESKFSRMMQVFELFGIQSCTSEVIELPC